MRGLIRVQSLRQQMQLGSQAFDDFIERVKIGNEVGRAFAIAINRLAGIDYPLWALREERT